MFDTHCHVYSEEIDNYRKVIEECNNNNISLIINSVDVKSSEEVINLSNEYNNVYSAIGINYDTIDSVEENDIVLLEKLIKNNKIVALGEIGLDYYWTKENKNKQIDFFKKQLKLAKKYDLPVIVHARESIQDVFDIIKESGVKKGSMHCYSGSVEMAREFVKLGFKIGIDGPITYKNNKKGIELVKELDLSNILLETDSPYLSPEPNRGKQNTPLNLIYIAEKVADIKGISVEEVINQTNKNVKETFRI